MYILTLGGTRGTDISSTDSAASISLTLAGQQKTPRKTAGISPSSGTTGGFQSKHVSLLRCTFFEARYVVGPLELSFPVSYSA